jgi:zinc transport system substrate-binding protein
MMVLATVLAGCLQADAEEAELPDVVTTAYPLTFIAQRIAGDDLQIQTLLPHGQDPYTWQPDDKELQRLASARLILHAGGVLDPWATHWIQAQDHEKRPPAAAVTQGILLPEAVHLHSVLHQSGWGEGDDHDHHHGHGHSHGHGHGHGHDHGSSDHDHDDIHGIHALLSSGDHNQVTFSHQGKDPGPETINYHCHLHSWKEAQILLHSEPHPDGPQTHHIQIIDDGTADPDTMRYDPPSVEIHNGDTVIWTNNGSLPHTVDAGHHSEDTEHSEGGHHHPSLHVDPHFWLDPIRTMTAVNNTLDALITLNPEQAATYAKRAQELNIGLKGLHENYRYGLRQCETRHLFVTEEAFGGISHRYNLYQHPLRTLEEPTVRPMSHISGVAHLAKHLGATHVYHTSPLDKVYAQLLSMETETGVLKIDTLRTVDPERISQGETYFSIMRDNLDNLRTGLRCL